jgi:hypothetical protein
MLLLMRASLERKLDRAGASDFITPVVEYNGITFQIYFLKKKTLTPQQEAVFLAWQEKHQFSITFETEIR